MFVVSAVYQSPPTRTQEISRAKNGGQLVPTSTCSCYALPQCSHGVVYFFMSFANAVNRLCHTPLLLQIGGVNARELLSWPHGGCDDQLRRRCRKDPKHLGRPPRHRGRQSVRPLEGRMLFLFRPPCRVTTHHHPSQTVSGDLQPSSPSPCPGPLRLEPPSPCLRRTAPRCHP